VHTLRRNVQGVVYHLIWRFVDKRYFVAGWRERSRYLHLLGEALQHTDWLCFAYAVMSNHIHLAMLAGRDPMSSWTRRVNSPFATWMNERVQRIGPVFAQGAKDFAIGSAREASLLAYIHRNPVRAGIAKRASESSWTSHRFFVGRAKPPPWLRVGEALARIGMTPTEFGRWVDQEEGDAGRVDIAAITKQLRKRGSLHAASPSRGLFPVVTRETGYWRPDPRLIVQLGCAAAGVSPQLVCSKRRIGDAMSARRAIALAALEQGLTFTEIGDALGLSRQAIAKMSRRQLSREEKSLMTEIRERSELEAGGASWVRPGQPLLIRGVGDR